MKLEPSVPLRMTTKIHDGIAGRPSIEIQLFSMLENHRLPLDKHPTPENRHAVKWIEDRLKALGIRRSAGTGMPFLLCDGSDNFRRRKEEVFSPRSILPGMRAEAHGTSNPSY
jgi:hypothetical protein